MAANYILLERIELAASAASVTFANIPQSGYTDLKIVYSTRSIEAATSTSLTITFNGSSASLTDRNLQGSGSAAASNTGSTYIGETSGASATANTFGNAEIYIPNYLSSNYKSFSIDSVMENNATTSFSNLIAGLWSNTAAVTSVGIVAGASSFAANSTFSLYGIAAVGTTPTIAPKASGGNVIETDGTYWYHTFLSSGTFTPQVGLSCDYLVVAGGGGGGGSFGAGGGGGGGVQTAAALSCSLGTNYTVTIGAGGTAGADANGGSGNSSVFHTFTAGGGLGGVKYSGAGGNSGTPQSKTGGAAGTPGPNTETGGAGAGAGANGEAGVTNTRGGNGGAGITSTYSGSSVTYAGGGGGGGARDSVSGTGTDGGGNGAANQSSTGIAGTANRGGGGGGSRTASYAGGTGGSGIVIIRYAV